MHFVWAWLFNLNHTITLFRRQVKQGEHYILFHQRKNYMNVFSKTGSSTLHYCEHPVLTSCWSNTPHTTHDRSHQYSNSLFRRFNIHTIGLFIPYTFEYEQSAENHSQFKINNIFLHAFSVKITLWQDKSDKQILQKLIMWCQNEIQEKYVICTSVLLHVTDAFEWLHWQPVSIQIRKVGGDAAHNTKTWSAYNESTHSEHSQQDVSDTLRFQA